MTDESESEALRLRWIKNATIFETANTTITESLAQATEDLAGLRLHRHDEIARPDDEDDSWVPSAGIPWFVTLFGRDALSVALQTLPLSPRFALGSLRALAALQADSYDDARDMQPGKIEHEVRHGELAQLHLIPHTPYYGTHEATTLYVLVAARAWRWHGDDEAIRAIRPNIDRALEWIDARRRFRPRRLAGVQDTLAEGLLQPGLEGLRRRDRDERWRAREAADRPL